MRWRTRVLWLLATLMFGWLMAMTLTNRLIVRCVEQGGQWSWAGWECRLLPPVQIRRGIERS